MKGKVSNTKPNPSVLQVWRQRLLRGVYFGLPPLILYVIVSRIDLALFRKTVNQADLFFGGAGLSMLVPIVALGAFRWHILMERYQCGGQPFLANLLEYWKSLAVGLLTPGSLGADAYRVIYQGQLNGLYLRGAFVITVEKLAALISCALLLALLYPMLSPNHLPKVLSQSMDMFYGLMSAGTFIGIVFLTVRRHKWMTRLGETINMRLESWLQRISPSSVHHLPQRDMGIKSGLNFIFSFVSPRIALPAVGLSICVYVLTSLQSQILFKAYGYTVPYQVNLFISPLLFLLYSLPISFGGLGIREGAFILAYSAFGVPAETALVVSLTGLIGNFISYGIGASLIWFGRKPKPIGLHKKD